MPLNPSTPELIAELRGLLEKARRLACDESKVVEWLDAHETLQEALRNHAPRLLDELEAERARAEKWKAVAQDAAETLDPTRETQWIRLSYEAALSTDQEAT